MTGIENNFSLQIGSLAGNETPQINVPFQNISTTNPSSNLNKTDSFKPSTSIMNNITPIQQLNYLGLKYNVPFNNDLDKFQEDIAKAVITSKANELGIPLKIAFGIAGNESGLKMWSNIQKGTVIKGKNIRAGVLNSTDWGVMQINDKAHKNVASKVKNNLELNIEYGLKFLAEQRTSVKGNLHLGFGDWDKTIASYNLGHSPSSANDLKIAKNYVSRVKNNSSKYIN